MLRMNPKTKLLMVRSGGYNTRFCQGNPPSAHTELLSVQSEYAHRCDENQSAGIYRIQSAYIYSRVSLIRIYNTVKHLCSGKVISYQRNRYLPYIIAVDVLHSTCEPLA